MATKADDDVAAIAKHMSGTHRQWQESLGGTVKSEGPGSSFGKGKHFW